MDSPYLSEFKKKAQKENAVIVYEDEASFRQSPTLHQTWAPKNSQPKIPTRGERNSQKILGAISMYNAQFTYKHQTEYFNAQTYIAFLEMTLLPEFYKKNRRIFLIQDNASYHKKPEVWDWFKQNRNKMEVFLLPPYSPELNAIERLWHYTRMHATHNRYFETPHQLCEALFATFSNVRKNPDNVKPLLMPYF
jgi:transposase